MISFFKKLIENLKKYFRREYLVPPEKVRELSNGCFERGVFKFFRPVYLENGVELYLEDREGFKKYKEELEKNSLEKNSYKKNLDEYLDPYIQIVSSYGKKYEEKILRFVEGLKKSLEWILENTTPFKDYREIEFSFCPSYSGFEIKRTKNGYKFVYG
ncbi:MAG: hypothetical protein QW273_01010 [Candidatus Pacearchaeota archaeon]